MNQASLPHVFLTLLRRDLLLTARSRNEWLNPVLFFIIVVSLFPLAIGPETNTLKTIAPGIIWVSALLATLLSLDGLFRSDFIDGTLEQLLLSPHSMSVLVLAKTLAHWLATGLPLILLSPLLAIFMHIPLDTIPLLMLTLLLGTPVLSLIGAIGAALTVGLRRGGVLISLLVLPLYIPVLIFAANAVATHAMGLSVESHLSLLGALLFLSLALAPWAAASALRISLE